MNGILLCVILNYNDAELSERTARLAAELHEIYKVIIVDNCSTDHSLLRLQQVNCDKIVVVSTDHNGGYGYGNNYGIRYAFQEYSANYVLVANPDVEFSEEYVKRLRQVFQINPNCAVVSGLQRIVDGDLIISAWRIPSIWHTIFKGELIYGILNEALIRHNNARSDRSVKPITLQRVDCVAGSLLMVDATKFLNAGGYDEDFFLYMEETVLGSRMKDRGYDTYLCTDVSYLHKHGASISKLHHLASRRSMLWKSTDLYLRKYKGVGIPLRFIGKIAYFIGTMEMNIYNWIKKLFEATR